jgi:succinyl-CoA synthetase beta subunit
MWKRALGRDVVRQILGARTRELEKVPRRNMNLLEYQSKQLLMNIGVNIQKFVVCSDEASLKTKLDGFKATEYVIKAQVLAGGRGKGHFDTGFKGGVHVVKDFSKVRDIVKSMLGNKLITKQTPKEGVPVTSVMVAESVEIFHEKYLSFLLDRDTNGVLCIASPCGGMDIEEVAEKTPEKVKKVVIDVFNGMSGATATEISKFLGFEGTGVDMAASEILKLYHVFNRYDVILLEINPFATTNQGIISVDAKITIDDCARFRLPDLFAQESTDDLHPREVEAAKANLNYIQMNGNIGCLVNGAGLAMATMDIIKLYGGEPANFLDVGGNVNEAQVTEAFRILTSDPNVKCILINVFGGIVNCATIAGGVISACRSIGLKVPLVVRLEGTNVHAAKDLLKKSGLAILSAEDLDDAAQKAVKCLA